jgi:hypothetical protein
MSDQPAELSDQPCGAPVTIPNAFTPVVHDTGHLCQRPAGHSGPHRWQQRWEGASPRQVEAEIAADYEKWDKPDDE